jgi:hypothetical protein
MLKTYCTGAGPFSMISCNFFPFIFYFLNDLHSLELLNLFVLCIFLRDLFEC